MGSPTPTTKPAPMRLYNPSAPSQLPATPLLWCNPVTMTLEQIKENTQCLLHEWPENDGIPFLREVLGILRDLRAKDRIRDEERIKKGIPLTKVDVETPGEPKPNQGEEIPAQ